MRFFPQILAASVALVVPQSSNAFVLAPRASLISSSRGPTSAMFSHDSIVEEPDSNNDSRRAFLSSMAASVAGLSMAQMLPNEALAAEDKVLVLGGTGFVGSKIVSQLKSMGVPVVATSRDGRDGTEALDVSSGIDVAAAVQKLASGCTAVISTIGAIGTDKDGPVNAASGLAANGAKAAGVKRFVYISVAPEVRQAAKGIKFLDDYMTGKQYSEDSIKYNFGGEGTSYTLIEPTFIYGGDKFALKPPRVATGYGKLIEGILSSGPFRAAAGVAPGFIGVALEPPVPVTAVAGAAIAGALGKSAPVLDTYDKINDAAKQA